MKKFFADNWIVLTIGTILIASMLMAISNKQIIQTSSAEQQQAQYVKEQAEHILSKTMHGLDLGLRGFALTKDSSMLIPYHEAIEKNDDLFKTLESILKEQNYSRSSELKGVKGEVDAYMAFCNQIIKIVPHDSANEVVSMLREDRGYGVWKKYDEFTKPLFAFEDKIIQNSITNYNAAIRNNLILQILMVALALPALILFIRKLGREREARTKLILEVQRNDQVYVFNEGTEVDESEKNVIETSIKNIRMASDFIQALARGNYDIGWTGLNKENSTLNKDALAGNLIDLREKLKKIKVDDERRNWGNEGLTRFAELVRNHQADMDQLSDRCVSFLTKYLEGQQGNLFLLENKDSDRYLNLVAFFAFDSKKICDKRIDIGSGLIGQSFADAEVVRLENIPDGYMKIKSGLGASAPAQLVIVPFKMNENVVGVVEIASFSVFEDHQIDFLMKAGEIFASAILNSRFTGTRQAHSL